MLQNKANSSVTRVNYGFTARSSAQLYSPCQGDEAEEVTEVLDSGFGAWAKAGCTWGDDEAFFEGSDEVSWRGPTSELDSGLMLTIVGYGLMLCTCGLHT